MKKNYTKNKPQSRQNAFSLILFLLTFFFIENSSYSPSNLATLDRQLGLDQKDATSVSSSTIEIHQFLPSLALSLGPKPDKESPADGFTRKDVLSDSLGRISHSLAIPERLKERVGFWMDIYSFYPSSQRVIHHVDFPWLIFEVVNVSDILSQPARFKWMNPEKADKVTKKRRDYVEYKLRNLYKKLRKNKAIIQLNLDDDEKRYLSVIEKISGSKPESLIRNIANASKRVRIQVGQKDFFLRGISEAYKYFPQMEKIFIDYGLPPEISRLPLVESSFEPKATSKVGAAGPWQFMPNTGKKFLIVNDYIDERRSPIKSTEAAAELIKENYIILKKSWPLAITAWNHGPSGIRKASQKVNSNDLATIIEKFQSRQFSFASENFYCEFLAALYSEKYADKLFENLKFQQEIILEKYTLTKKMKSKVLLKLTQMTENEFLILNPDVSKALKHDFILPKGFIIYLTPDKISNLAALY